MSSQEREPCLDVLITQLAPLFNGLQAMLSQTEPLRDGRRAAVAYDRETGSAIFAVTDESGTQISLYPVVLFL